MPKLKEKRAWVRICGHNHKSWKGDSASINSKRERARRLYELTECEICKKPATDRHHIDGDTGNNKASNISILCRRCHMIVDGRLAKLPHNNRPIQPPKPCRTCGNLSKPLWNGECHKCDMYRRNHNGVSRPAVEDVTQWKKKFGDCPNCDRKNVRIYSHGTCNWCYRAKWMKEDRAKKSRNCHRFLHDHPRYARENGFLK